MEELLQQILQECRPYTGQGALASYIPELARQDPDRLGIAVFDKDGNMVEAGDSRRCFTIQSVMKPLLLLLALQDNGRETVRAHVGVEATGKPFDAINVADNALLAKHLNPMVNAGAILMCQLVGGETYDQRFARLLGFIRRLAANEKIDLDEEVYHSEKATGSKNRALAYLLKAHGLLHGDVEELLDCYFRACSIRVSAADLARIGCVLACHGQLPDGQRLFPAAYGRFVNANLMTCGMYDGSGDFAIRVGVPAKSGVGGGIMAVVPGRMGVGLFGPALDEKGAVANPAAHTYDVRATLDNAAGELLPGMVCRVTVSPAESAEEIAVPLRAVQQAGDGSRFVWTVRGDSAVRTAVTTGRLVNNGIVLTGGVAAGDRIVVDGMQKIGEGSKVVWR